MAKFFIKVSKVFEKVVCVDADNRDDAKQKQLEYDRNNCYMDGYELTECTVVNMVEDPE